MSSAANPTGWIEKARQDARSARRLLIDPPELENAAYHLHQAIEKASKAILIAEGVKFPRGGGAGHDLDKLAKLIPASNALSTQAQQLSHLTPWATAFRYPADDPFTAQPLPAKRDIERKLDDVDAFVDAVALQIAPPAPTVP